MQSGHTAPDSPAARRRGIQGEGNEKRSPLPREQRDSLWDAETVIRTGPGSMLTRERGSTGVCGKVGRKY